MGPAPAQRAKRSAVEPVWISKPTPHTVEAVAKVARVEPVVRASAPVLQAICFVLEHVGISSPTAITAEVVEISALVGQVASIRNVFADAATTQIESVAAARLAVIVRMLVQATTTVEVAGLNAAMASIAKVLSANVLPAGLPATMRALIHKRTEVTVVRAATLVLELTTAKQGHANNVLPMKRSAAVLVPTFKPTRTIVVLVARSAKEVRPARAVLANVLLAKRSVAEVASTFRRVPVIVVAVGKDALVVRALGEHALVRQARPFVVALVLIPRRAPAIVVAVGKDAQVEPAQEDDVAVRRVRAFATEYV